MIRALISRLISATLAEWRPRKCLVFAGVSRLRNMWLFLRDFSRRKPRHAWGSSWTGLAPLLRNGGYEGERDMRDNSTVRTLRTVAALLPVALLAPVAGCSNGSDGGALPPDVKAIVFLQRTPRGDQGNVFDYTSYAAGGRLVMLSPPSADGTLTTLFPTDASMTWCTTPAMRRPDLRQRAPTSSPTTSTSTPTRSCSRRRSAGDQYQLVLDRTSTARTPSS